MPVQLDLSEVLHTPGMRTPYDVNIPCNEELELDCVSPITGHLTFTNTGNVLVVQGPVRVTLRAECPRCLSPVDSVVDADVDEEFTVKHEQVTGRADDEEGMNDPTLRVMWEAGQMLDLTEMLRQNIVLALPMAPLCREDCKGLCPQCGANWNEATCDCEAPVDSPFSVLAGLARGEGQASPEE